MRQAFSRGGAAPSWKRLYLTYVGQIRIPLKIGRESLNESEPARKPYPRAGSSLLIVLNVFQFFKIVHQDISTVLNSEL